MQVTAVQAPTERPCRIWLPLLATALHAAACGGDGAVNPDGGADGGGDAGTPQKLLILHTNDIHSHLMGFAPEADYTPASPNDDTTRGGMARLAAAIGAPRRRRPPPTRRCCCSTPATS